MLGRYATNQPTNCQKVGARGRGGGGGRERERKKQTRDPVARVAGTNLPNLPDSFSLRVEVNIKNKNKTTTLHEFYDYASNVAAVRQVSTVAVVVVVGWLWWWWWW